MIRCFRTPGRGMDRIGKKDPPPIVHLLETSTPWLMMRLTGKLYYSVGPRVVTFPSFPTHGSGTGQIGLRRRPPIVRRLASTTPWFTMPLTDKSYFSGVSAVTPSAILRTHGCG